MSYIKPKEIETWHYRWNIKTEPYGLKYMTLNWLSPHNFSDGTKWLKLNWEGHQHYWGEAEKIIGSWNIFIGEALELLLGTRSNGRSPHRRVHAVSCSICTVYCTLCTDQCLHPAAAVAGLSGRLRWPSPLRSGPFLHGLGWHNLSKYC